ncbi:DJ-1/PfpI family protein [Undibacterium terreum]|uniref:DJ-1/PfpI family protein n=1 Tax=Undibacterium terreum TaxID=1224302 RepID=UPI003FCE2F28
MCSVPNCSRNGGARQSDMAAPGASTMQNVKRHTVYFLLLPDTLLIDMAGPADALLFANRYQKDIHFDLKFISPFPQIRSSVGLLLGELAPLPDELEADAILILPGLVGMEFHYDTPEEKAAIRWLRQQVKPSNRLICICSGALLAAHAGLLSNHAATTHHDHCKDLANIDSSIRVEENRIFVEQGMVSTSAGVTAGIDLALHLISQLAGPLTAHFRCSCPQHGRLYAPGRFRSTTVAVGHAQESYPSCGA